MNKVHIKCYHNYNDSVLERVKLMECLSKQSPIFPILHFEQKENIIYQFANHIPSHPLPKDLTKLKTIWNAFLEHLDQIHHAGYVHGDILYKNIIFDGSYLRLIDHELSLRHGDKLMVTYPWISIRDLISGNITKETDAICIKATELRLFDQKVYWKFRHEQQTKLKNEFKNSSYRFLNHN